MKFYGFIRGVDEFGRKTINTHEAEYTLIGIEPKVGDLMLFIDPKSRTSMTYIVKEEYPAPWKNQMICQYLKVKWKNILELYPIIMWGLING